MYLYFNKHGTLTTIIPHGEPVRQGSYLNIYVLLDEDFFSSKNGNINNYSVNVELIVPDNTLTSVKIGAEDGPQLLPFSKTSDSEMTYDLVQGRRYWTYHFRFPPSQSTMYAGKIVACVSIMEAVLADLGDTESVIEKDLLYLGKADIYIEKTFGTAKRVVSEGSLHYNNLVKQINIINDTKVSKLGDRRIILDDSYFVRDEEIQNYKTYGEESETIKNVLKSNKYQLVELTKDGVKHTYHLINDEEEQIRMKYYFIRFIDNQTISVLVFNNLDKKWYLYDNVKMLSYKDIESWIPISTLKGKLNDARYINLTKNTFSGFVYTNNLNEKLYFRLNSYKQTDNIGKKFYSSEEVSEDGKTSVKKYLIFNENDNTYEISTVLNGASDYRIILSSELNRGYLNEFDLSQIKQTDVVLIKNNELFNLNISEKTENINEYSFMQLNTEKSIKVNLETGEWFFEEDNMLSLDEEEILSLLI